MQKFNHSLTRPLSHPNTAFKPNSRHSSNISGSSNSFEHNQPHFAKSNSDNSVLENTVVGLSNNPSHTGSLAEGHDEALATLDGPEKVSSQASRSFFGPESAKTIATQ